jgi:hypothetical protein
MKQSRLINAKSKLGSTRASHLVALAVGVVAFVAPLVAQAAATFGG